MGTPGGIGQSGWTGPAGIEPDYNREVYFRRRMVNPPAMVYVTVDDVFVLKVLNPTTPATVNVSIRYMDQEGEVIPQFQQFPNLPASSAVRTVTFRGSEGFVLSATISTPGASAGAVYVQLEVGRGVGSQDITEGHLLIGGYPGSFAALGFPQTQPQPPSAGAGVSRSVTVVNPAAGADFSVTVPAGASWLLNSVAATFATSATVGTRTPVLLITDATGHAVFSGATAFGQAASLTWSYSWTVAPVTPPAGGTTNVGPLPGGRYLGPIQSTLLRECRSRAQRKPRF